ncbi:MAG TPA: addiction module toxin, HicA family [Oceanospirillaceae bacterium]|nr:addiction module toxin, HicA family [Oceanospirillaceae bacterium]
MKSKELIKQIEMAGWVCVRTKGSHHQFKHPNFSHLVTIPHPKNELGIGLVKKIRKDAGL